MYFDLSIKVIDGIHEPFPYYIYVSHNFIKIDNSTGVWNFVQQLNISACL